MYGFTLTTRLDAPAELFGVGGFLLSLSAGGTRWARLAGVLLLIVAVLTKQTAGAFLLAVALARAWEGRGRQALGGLAGALAGLFVVVVAVDLLREPLFARSLLAQAKMPWDFVTWSRVLYRIASTAPDLLLLPVLGLWLWLGKRPREVGPAALAVSLLAASLGLSWKVGADTNYYLNLRVVEGMAVGTLWHAVFAAETGRDRARSAALAAAAALAVAALFVGLGCGAVLTDAVLQESVALDGPTGQRLLQSYGIAIAQARNPKVHLLTDSGLIDAYQGERAVSGDPWMFHWLVETGRIRPTTLLERIDSHYYDLIITTHDIRSPDYITHDFRLPQVVFERARARYVLRDRPLGLYFYVPRRQGRPTGDERRARPTAVGAVAPGSRRRGTRPGRDRPCGRSGGGRCRRPGASGPRGTSGRRARTRRRGRRG
jgi:hypothetical protein